LRCIGRSFGPTAVSAADAGGIASLLAELPLREAGA